MYAYIKGRITHTSTTYVIVEANGIGFLIHIPVSAYATLPHIGSEVTLYTAYIVREQSQSLYGFLTTDEKDLFEVLLGVTGIGPKTALSLIGHLCVHDFAKAIQDHDLSLMCKVPGIGRKTAERLLLEVRDKLPSMSSPTMLRFAVKTPLDPHAQTITDAMNALIHLGYTQGVAEKAIKKSMESFSDKPDLPQLITTALKHV